MEAPRYFSKNRHRTPLCLDDTLLRLEIYPVLLLDRVTQFVQLTYIAALAVALAAARYQRLELLRRRSMVLAHL